MNVFNAKTAALLAFFVGVLYSNGVSANDPSLHDSGHDSHRDSHQPSHQKSHGDGHDKKHYLGMFVGAYDGEETDPALGIEYEYRFNSHWGIGALYEHVADAHHGDGISSTIGALYFHPKGAWRLGMGFGRERVGGTNSHSEDLYRVGISYDFHVGKFGIAPSLNVDRVDGETARVLGVAFVYSF